MKRIEASCAPSSGHLAVRKSKSRSSRTKPRNDEIVRKPILGRPVDGKPANDGYRCELCGTWIEYRDLGKVLAHEGAAAAPQRKSEAIKWPLDAI
jgi:hypothetical protein